MVFGKEKSAEGRDWRYMKTTTEIKSTSSIIVK